MKRIISGLFLLAFSLVLLLVQGCNDAPSDVGSVVVIDTLNAHTISSLDSNIMTSATVNLSRSYLFNGAGTGSLYVGVSTKTRALSLCRFIVPDTMRWMTAAKIESAVMLIRPRPLVIGSGPGDSTLSFNVLELTKSFMLNATHPTVTWTDLISSGITPSPNYFGTASKPMASYTGTIPQGSVTDISIPLNSDGIAVIARWLAQDSAGKANSVFGLGLIPQSNSKVLQEFSTKASSADTMPFVRINVIYRDSLNMRDSVVILSGNDATFVDADTLQSPFMLVQPTLASTARFVVDARSIPITDAILKAQFSFSVDTTQTLIGNVGTDTLLLIPSYDTKDTSGTTVTSQITKYYLPAFRAPGSSQYVCQNMGAAIDFVRPFNGGLLYLDVQSKGTNLERHAVYDLKGPVDKRPVITITYAVRPTIGQHK